MSEINIPPLLRKKLNAIEEAAHELSQKQELLIGEFENALQEIERVYSEAADESEEDTSASDLFQEDGMHDDMNDIASHLGGKVGGDYGSIFEFWIPSNC